MKNSITYSQDTERLEARISANKMLLKNAAELTGRTLNMSAST